MKWIVVAIVILTIPLILIPDASAEEQPKAKPTDAAPKIKPTDARPAVKVPPQGDFVIGYIDTVQPGNPTILTIGKIIEASDSLRSRVKSEGKVTAELSLAVMRSIEGGAAALRVGERIRLQGVIRDDRLVVTSASLVKGK